MGVEAAELGEKGGALGREGPGVQLDDLADLKSVKWSYDRIASATQHPISMATK